MKRYLRRDLTFAEILGLLEFPAHTRLCYLYTFKNGDVEVTAEYHEGPEFDA